jgi:hypothetical protein
VRHSRQVARGAAWRGRAFVCAGAGHFRCQIGQERWRGFLRAAVTGVGCSALRLHLAGAGREKVDGCSGLPPSRNRLTYWITSSAVANSVSDDKAERFGAFI